MAAHNQTQKLGPNNLPSLRFDTGDVIIKLSNAPSEWLLVHSDMMKEKMEFLALSLKPHWLRPVVVVHPVLGKSVEVYTLAMTVQDDTMFLGGKDLVDVDVLPHAYDTNASLELIHRSLLAEGTWPDPHSILHPHEMLEKLGTLHRALFAMLYGYPVSIKALLLGEESDVNGAVPRGSLSQSIAYISCSLCLAEYYGALSFIAPILIDLLAGRRDFWEDVARLPQYWHPLATKLRWTELHLDATRHLYASGNDEMAKHVLGLEEDELQDYRNTRLPDLKPTVDKLKWDLVSLHLTPQRWSINKYNKFTAHTTFFDALDHKEKDRSDHTKMNELADHQARDIFSEWITKHIVEGDDLDTDSKGYLRARSPGPWAFSYACYQLVRASEKDDPSKIFGFKVAERLATMHHLDRRFKPDARVRATIIALVAEAAGIINKAFPEVREMDENGVEITYKRAHYWQRQGLTYIGLGENDLPWAEAESDRDSKATMEENGEMDEDDLVQESVESDEKDKAIFDVTKASKPFLRALGML